MKKKKNNVSNYWQVYIDRMKFIDRALSSRATILHL